MKKLRRRPRPDDLNSERRKNTRSKGRIVYLAILGFLVLSVLNFIFGDYLFLRATGLVLRERTSVESTFLARIESINVGPGQTVVHGEPLFRIQSTEILERLADLSARRADLAAKATDFKIRAETAAALMPLASKREQETLSVLSRLDELTNTGLLTTARYDEALQSRYQARESLIRLQAQKQALEHEISALDAARKDAAAALSDLRTHYNDGIVFSPVQGSIGSVVPSVGDVYQPGEVILTVYSGEQFILAFLPSRYLFPIKPGMEVMVKSGRISAKGTLTDILPVTDSLPQDFRDTFRPGNRHQLARIEFSEPPPFPLHEKVRVTRNLFSF